MTRLTGLLLAASCAGAAAPAPLPAGYHGVVVWAEPGGPRVQAVAFTPRWERRPAGADSVDAFSRVPLADGWGASGRMQGDTLVWILSRMQGDAGISVELAGTVRPDGSVTGCARPPRRPAEQSVSAAFALAPSDRPLPTAADAPLGPCTSNPEVQSS